VDAVISYDSASFAAGQDAGARIAACVARLAALQLVEDARWWNRWRCRVMAGALVRCAEDMESAADASRPATAGGPAGGSPLRLVLAGRAR
jgi:hypothetical protein